VKIDIYSLIVGGTRLDTIAALAAAATTSSAPPPPRDSYRPTWRPEGT